MSKIIQCQPRKPSNFSCEEIFCKFIAQIENVNYIEVLQKAEQIYSIREFKVGQLSPLMVTEIYHNIVQKFTRNFTPKFELNWWENQLRIFVWSLVLYVDLKQTQVENLNSTDWEFFSSIFPHKKQILFEYQSINILKEHGQAKKWIPQEDELFTELVHEKGLKCKWSELAKILYIQSEKLYFRTPKQCRQRWLNHLDPSKCKSDWEPAEDYRLIHYVLNKGKKWAEISKILVNKRNEHSIKNRFKSLITKEEKFHKEKLTEQELISWIFARHDAKFNHELSKMSESMEKSSQQSASIHLSLLKPNSLGSGASGEIDMGHSNSPLIPRVQKQGSFKPFRYFSKGNTESKPQINSPNPLSPIFKNSILPRQNPQIRESASSFVNPGAQVQTRHLKLVSLHSEQVFGESESRRNNNESQNLLGKHHSAQFLSLDQNEPAWMNDEMQPNFRECDSMNEMLEEPLFKEEPQRPEWYRNIFEAQIKEEETKKLSNNNSRSQQGSQVMDDRERGIRAEIFLAQDPFELLKPYFLQKKQPSEEYQKQPSSQTAQAQLEAVN